MFSGVDGAGGEIERDSDGDRAWHEEAGAFGPRPLGRHHRALQLARVHQSELRQRRPSRLVSSVQFNNQSS